MTTILWLCFLKESSDELLYVSDGNFYFLFTILFSLIENVLKTWAYIGDFAFFVSYTNERSLPNFEFSYVGNEKEFLAHGAYASLKL